MQVTNVTRENLSEVSNAALKAFFAERNIKQSVSNKNRDAANARALEFFDAQATTEAEAPSTALVTTDAQATTEAEANPQTEAEAEAARIEAEAEAARIEAEANAEKQPDAPATNARKGSNSEGVARSWLDPEVRRTRLTRDGIYVTSSDGAYNDNYFKSTSAAFRAIRLPHEKHIKFRLSLKASRKENFTHNGITYTFVMLG